MLQRPERRQVLIAVPVNLVGAHDDMASAPGQCLEDPAERHPALDRPDDTDRGCVGQQPGLTVGQHDVGGEGQAGQAGADRHHGRHRADHDLAGVAEQFGARDGAHLGTVHRHHFPASLSRLGEFPHGRLVIRLAAGQVGLHELLPGLVGCRGLGVVPLELLVAAVVRLGGGEVGAVGGLDDAVHHHAVDQQRLRRYGLDQFLRGHHPFDGQVAPLRGHEKQVVEVRVDTGVGGIALGITEIQVHEGGIEGQRGHRDQFLETVFRAGASDPGIDGGVRRLHGLEFIAPERAHVAAQPRADRQERQALRGGLQPAAQHALVHLTGLDGTGGARLGEPRVVERR